MGDVKRTIDHHRADSAYQRFNAKVAEKITGAVGTMTCCYLFCGLALASLPAVLSAFNVFTGVFPDWAINVSVIALVAWVAQTFLQLVLLPALMVGQNLQSAAADARAAQTFQDVERIIDALDTHTQGGLKEVLDAIKGGTDGTGSSGR